MADSDNPAPQPNFDFIMKEEPKPQRSFKLPSNIPKPVFIGGVVVLGLFLLLIIGSIFSGGSGNSTEVYKLLSDATVIGGASDDATLYLTKPDSKTVAATTEQTMASQKTQLKSYLTSQKTKYNAKLVRTLPDSATVTSLKNAQLNNTYDQVYLGYLKSSLTSYQSDIKASYDKAGPKLKVILNDAYASNTVLLSNPPLK
jgi:hypothetical protein